MPRDLPIGNGSLLITFDAQYCLRDLFFPNVGHENNTLGHPCRVGVWIDGSFRWLHDREGWERSLQYEPEPSGVLAEQLDPYSGTPCMVAPLTWSHATYVDVILKYQSTYPELFPEQEAPVGGDATPSPKALRRMAVKRHPGKNVRV